MFAAMFEFDFFEWCVDVFLVVLSVLSDVFINVFDEVLEFFNIVW